MSHFRIQRTELDKRMSEIANSIIKPISLKELMTKEFPEIKWVVEKLLPSEGIIALSGQPSAYKTWLILHLSIQIAKGEIVFDKYLTSKTGILIVDEETGEPWIKERIMKMQADQELPIYLLSKTGFKLSDSSVKDLIMYCQKYKISLIIFDSLLRIHTARDENDAVEMAKVISLFQKLNKVGLTVIFTHHNRKQGLLRSTNPSQDMRGSSDILAAVDCHLAIERKEEMITIYQTKLRQGEELKPFQLDVITDENEFRFDYAGEVEEEQTKKIDFKEAIKDILTDIEKPLYKKELYDQLRSTGIEGGYSTFKIAIKELIDKGELFEQRGERNKMFCSVKPFNEKQSNLLDTNDSQNL